MISTRRGGWALFFGGIIELGGATRCNLSVRLAGLGERGTLTGHFFPPANGNVDITGLDVDAVADALGALGSKDGCPRAYKPVDDNFAGLGDVANCISD